MSDCVFCKIIAKEIPAELLFEDEHVMAFMDIKPVSRGHCLVIPKQHFADVVDAPEDLVTKVILATKRLALAVEKAVSAHGFTLSTNRGLAAGQTVFHLHFHIIPRFDNDGLKPWQHYDIEPQTRAELATEIRKHLV